MALSASLAPRLFAVALFWSGLTVGWVCAG